MNRSAHTPGHAVLVLALSAGAFLLGCAPHAALTAGTAAPPTAAATSTSSQGAAAAPSTPPARLNLAERHEIASEADRAAVRVRTQLDASFTAGQAALAAGDQDAAYDDFDQALDAVVLGDIDLDAHPDLRDRVEEVMASIDDLAAEAAAEPDAPGEEAPAHPTLEGQSAGDMVLPSRPVGDCCPNLTIPMVQHPSVDAMIRFYTGKAKDRFELGLRRYGKYAPTVERIFKDEGVPPELAWLALVESNYNPQAYSHARARGLWQFIPGTGKLYGLKQDFWSDERSDFEKSTRSAARYLRTLHDMFDDWHLALAAYNAGEGKIARAIKSTGEKDFWQIRETRAIRRETKDYVPAFLAVLSIVHDPASYGITYAPEAPLQWDTCSISSCTDLSVIAQCAGTTTETISELNPELRRGTTPGGDHPYALRIPSGQKTTFTERYQALPPEQLLSWSRHVVARGETLASIARSYGTSVGSVMAANGMSASSRLTLGHALVIPTGPAADEVPAAVLASRAPDFGRDDAEQERGVRRSYRVRPGDTLAKVAARHGIPLSRLAAWNGLRNTHKIHAGQRLTLYASTRTASSSGQGTHLVRSGETLTSIAQRHGMSVQSLRTMNGLGSGDVVRTGQKIRLGGGSAASSSAAKAKARLHVVKPGDTLTKIARLYRTSVDNIRSWNALNHAACIHPGDRLTIRN